LGALPSTTLGYEKLFNPAFQFDDVEQFIQWLLDDQPEIPRYFAHMKQSNKAGPELLANLSAPARISGQTLAEQIEAGEMVIDLRAAEEYRRAYLRGTINIPATAENFTTYIGWFVDYDRPLYLILSDVAELGEILRSLRAIGVDQIAGYTGPDGVADGMNGHSSISTIDAQELAERKAANDLAVVPVIIDVRGRSEYRQRHIVGARNIPLGFLPQHLDQLPHDGTIVVHCASGYRSQIAASLLRAKGFDNVVQLQDSKERWSRLLETTTGD
jgi:hydroxyacylglutathione hydrolase